jgi:hypothetical protein
MANIINIADTIYEMFAELLVFNIGSRPYLSDKISVVEGDMEFTLSFSVVAHYSKSRDEGTYGLNILSDITPVWWDFEAVEGGVKFITDFSFDELKTHML